MEDGPKRSVLGSLALPFTWLRAFRHVRKFFTLDGAHLSSAYGGVLLTAACLDRNDQIILLEWAIVPQESDEGWRGSITGKHSWYPLKSLRRTVART